MEFSYQILPLTSITNFIDEWSYTFTPAIRLYGVVLRQKKQDNFTLPAE
jgi:hypothetical protein